MFLLLGVSIGLVLLGLYLWHVDHGMRVVPAEVTKLSPHRWTDEEVRETYKRLAAKPLDWTPHLPPKLDRRYVVVGGSGLVGGFLVLQLLARGQSPESIRIVDFRKPFREDLNRGKAKEVEFVQADITNMKTVKAAFAKPWPKSVASLPMTVVHTAASIRPGERNKIFLNRCAIVDINGTENVLGAARDAGASIFLATSSASISIRPVSFWIAPWRTTPKGYVQIYKDPERDETLRPHGDYFSNYAWTKARAEDIVLKANAPRFRTGCIRPACAIYGNKYDISFGSNMAQGHVETWIPGHIQNCVNGQNIALAHLLHEAAVLANFAGSGGRAYAVTDPGDVPSFGDTYAVMRVCCGVTVTRLPSILMLVMAYAIEAYTLLLARFAVLKAIGLAEPTGNIALLQPAVITLSTAHQFAFDGPARKSVEEGGLGYKGVGTSLEGMVNQAVQYNQEVGRKPNWEK